MPMQGSGRTRHTSLLEVVHVYPSPSQALPLQVSMHWEQQECFGSGKEGQGGKMLGYVPHCILRAVLLCALAWWTKQTGFIHILGLTELSDKAGPAKNCHNSRCCGLQDLEIPCVRNVGLRLESWNFIWEHLSIHQKRITNVPANLCFTGFGCI